MSDPYSALAGGGVQEDDPYSKLGTEPTAEVDPYSALASTPAMPPPQAAPLETPSVVDYGSEALKRLVTPFPEQMVASPLRAAGVAASTGGLQVENRDLAAEQQQVLQGASPVAMTPPQSFSYPRATDLRESKLYQAGEATSEWVKQSLAPRDDVLNPFVADLLSGAGSLAANIAQASIPIVGMPSLALTAPMQGISEAAQRAVKFGATPEQQVRAAGLGSISGATEFIDALLPSLGTPAKVVQFLGKVGAKVAVGAFVEGGQEGVQQLIQNAIAKGIYNPNQALGEDVAYNTLIGALVGGAAKPLLDRSSQDGRAPTEGETSNAYEALVTQENAPPLVGTPIPQADPSTAIKEPLAPQPSVTQPPSISPIEQLLTQPPVTETHAHIIESAPFSPDLSSDAAVAAVAVKSPEGTFPLQEERLKKPAQSTDEALAAIYEVLYPDGVPPEIATPPSTKKVIPINQQLDEAVEKVEFTLEPEIEPADKNWLNNQISSIDFPSALDTKKPQVEATPAVDADQLHEQFKSKPLELTSVEQGAVSYWTDPAGYKDLNNYLRGKNKSSKAIATVPVLDAAINKSSLDAPVVAWRGVHGPQMENLNKASGENVWNVGYLATTIDQRRATHYGKKGGGVLLAYHLPAGAKGLYTSHPKSGGWSQAERELLLPRGQVFKITKKEVIKSPVWDYTGKLTEATPQDFTVYHLEPTTSGQYGFQLDAVDEGGKGIAKFATIPVVNTTPEQWTEALIESGESVPVQSTLDALEETTQEPTSPIESTKSLFYKETEFISLDEASKYANPAEVKKQIIAHNKKISAGSKAKNKSFYYPQRVNPSAKQWKLYHGSPYQFETFKDPLEKGNEKGIFFSPAKSLANSFGSGGTIYEVKVVPGKTKVVDLAKAASTKEFMKVVLKHNLKVGGWMTPQSLEALRKEHAQKHAKAKKEKVEFYQKYGVPKLISPPKTGYDWGGIHAAIEEARAEGLDTLILRNINEGGGHDQIVVLNPNRVFNLKTKKLMFSLSMGGRRYNTSKLTPEAASRRKEMEDEVVALLSVWKQRLNSTQNAQAVRLAVEQVAGPQVAARTQTPQSIQIEDTNVPAWGGEVPSDAAGFYSPRAERDMAMPLIAVAVGGSSERSLVTAYHESWHAIEGTLTPAEVTTLRNETEAMRAFVSQHNPKDADLYARAEPEEIWAETAAFYSYSQTHQRAKIYSGPAASVFEKIHQLLQTIKKIVANYGFQHSGEIFQKFYDGEMAERRLGLPTTMLERWWAQENGGKLSLSQASEKLERNTERNQRALRQVDPGLDKAPAQFETLYLHDAVGKLFSMTTGGPPAVPPQVQQALAHADGLAWRHKVAWGLDRLVDLHPRFKPLLRYAERIREMRTDAARIQDRALTIAKSWRRLGKQMENLAQLIDWNTNMKYLTPQERAQGVIRMPTQVEFNAAVSSFQVNAAGLRTFQETKNFFEVFLKLSTQNAIETAQRTITNPVALANKIIEIQTKEQNLLKRPYFPFLRFGSHYVTVKDAQGKVLYFETFERKGLRSAKDVQQAAHKRIEAALAPGEVATFGKLSESSTPFIGLPPELLESIQAELLAMNNASGNTPGLTAAQVDAIEQLRYQMAPAASFSHRFQNKDYTPGYSHDFLRAFSRYAFHGARYYARTKYGWALRGHIAEAETLGKNSNDNRIGDLVSYMNDHLYNTVLDTKGDWGIFKGGIFLWVFGFSVAGATLNLSQVPMVTYPWLAAKFGGIGKGDAVAVAALTRAATNINNFHKKGKYIVSPNVPQAMEMKAIGYGVQTGRISESQAAELAGLAQGNTLLGLGNNKVERSFQWILEKGAWMFEMAEQFNRRVTFRAALELAKKYPNSTAVKEAKNKYADELQQLINSQTFNAADAEAVITAIHAVEQTQFVYARENRPRFMRGRLAGTVFTFQTYYNNMIQLMGANLTSVTPRMLLVLMGMAGLMGLPGAEDLEDVINIVGRKIYGKDFNLRRQMREFLIQSTNEDATEILLHGMARRGFGIPALGDLMGEAPGRGLGSGHSNNLPLPLLDRSKALSMGRALPVNIGALDPTDTDKAISQEVQRASGAVFGVGFNLVKLMMELNQGTAHAKSWERAMPRALAGATSTWNAYKQERVVMRGGPESGATLVPYDPRDTEQAAELIARALGYMPLRESMKWDAVIAELDARKRLEIEQKVILDNFFEAKMGRREEEMDNAKNRIEKYNDNLPDWGLGYRIGADNLETAMEGRAREKNAREAGVPTQARNRPIAEFIQGLFPGSVVDVRRVR